LFIKLKRDISPIFPDIRLAGEMFQKTQEVPAYLQIGAGYYREMVLLCLKKQLALSIKLKRDISPIFPDIRLAGEMFQKTQEVPAYLHPSAVKCRSRILEHSHESCSVF